MLLYIHVPFCRSRCKYCSFYSKALGRNQRPETSLEIREYINTLLLELALWADQLGRVPVSSIFFGGGTPSLLPAKIIGVILERVHRYFSVASDVEVTLEANPESLRGTLQPSQYLSAGVNRLSIGIQSLDGRILHSLGRIHKEQDSLQSFMAAREAGFANIGVDLMWGVPGQSVRHWLQTLKDITRLAPEHISAYGLSLDPGTPLEREHAEGKILLPPERDQNIMFLEGGAFLESHGYIHYEISNFARMGYQCRHNTGYWLGEEYLGVGPSATSTIRNRRWTNPASQKQWDERIRAGRLGGEEEELTPLIQVLEMIMLRLRTARGLALEEYQKCTGHDFLRDHRRLILAMHENELIRIRNGFLRLTRKGMLVSNSILSNLFENTKTVLQNASQKREERPEASEESIRNLLEDTVEIRPVVWPKVEDVQKRK